MKYTCRDCVYDVLDKDDPDWKECTAPRHIPDEIFETYDDDELPANCGQFKLKNA